MSHENIEKKLCWINEQISRESESRYLEISVLSQMVHENKSRAPIVPTLELIDSESANHEINNKINNMSEVTNLLSSAVGNMKRYCTHLSLLNYPFFYNMLCVFQGKLKLSWISRMKH